MRDSPSLNARSGSRTSAASPRHLNDIVLGVVRDGQLLRVDEPEADAVETRRQAVGHQDGPLRGLTCRTSRCATCPCCRGSAPTAPTCCAPTWRRPSPAGVTRCCCGWTRATRCWSPAAGSCSARRRTCPTPPSRRGVPRAARGRQARVGDPRRAGGPRGSRRRVEVLDLRRGGPIFDDVSAQLVATATALLNWHDKRAVQRR